jgi:hypothetical protein
MISIAVRLLRNNLAMILVLLPFRLQLVGLAFDSLLNNVKHAQLDEGLAVHVYY